LTGFVAGLARKTVAHNVTINNLLPGPFDTERLAAIVSAAAAAGGNSVDAVREARRLQNPAQRFGTPAEFGAMCAFLCSSHAGYLTGQNIWVVRGICG
jgi:3-oxoacyl-[acyl-carrier protein] reductase